MFKQHFNNRFRKLWTAKKLFFVNSLNFENKGFTVAYIHVER